MTATSGGPCDSWNRRQTDVDLVAGRGLNSWRLLHIVTGHGLSIADDAVRASFIPSAIDGLGEAMEAGVPVIGYCHWTLKDNFEWIFGYTRHLGLFSVDRETLVRIPKPSARVYEDVVSQARAAEPSV